MRGSVRKHGKSWQYLVRGADGRWHTKSGFERRKDAEDALNKALGAISEGRFVEPAKVTVEQYLELEWLPAVKGTVSASTFANYEVILRRVHQLKHHPGLSAAVFTQLTDVETEDDGILTYDRALVKADPARLALANQGYLPPILPAQRLALDDKTGRYFPHDLDPVFAALQADRRLFIDHLDVRLLAPDDRARIHYTTDTTELTKPIDSVCDVVATSVMSDSIRWSGLSIEPSMNLPR